MEDHYATLGVNSNASQDEIKKAYRKLAFKHHPDKSTGNKSEFQKIGKAYEHLEDPQKRRQYDMARNSPFAAMGGGGGMGSPDDILKMFFGGGIPFGGANVRVFHGGQSFPMPGMPGMAGMSGFPMEEPRPLKPHPINKTVTITLTQAYSGINLPIEIERTVSELNERRKEVERVYIDIPMGIDQNEIITVQNKGNVMGNAKGDIKVRIHIENKSDFLRDGLNLIYTKKVSLKEALIGFSFDINHLSGKTYRINNKDGKVITDKYVKVVKYMGLKRERRHPASPIVGDLVIKFAINFPEELTDEQKKAIEEAF